MRALLCAVIALLSTTVHSANAQDLRVLQSSNGHGAFTLDLQTRQLDAFWPAIYRVEAPGVVVPDLLFDAYLGVVVDGRVTWLRDVAFEEATFEPGTAIASTCPGRGPSWDWAAAAAMAACAALRPSAAPTWTAVVVGMCAKGVTE